MKFTLILLLFLSIVFYSCNNQKPNCVNLKIIQTTDIHGTIFPYDFVEQKKVSNSLASIASFVKSVRDKNPDRVILLDNGDFLQGQPTVYYYNFEDTIAPHLGAEVLNFMGYDAATVGNHDIETGHAVYDRFRKQLKMPYLAANAIEKNTGKPYFTPYTIIERQGVKVSILGLITPAIPNWIPENLWQGIEFKDMVVSAKKWIKIIQEKEKPDLIIGMFHSGIDHMYGNPGGVEFMNENASKLVAKQVPGFDIILAGHDHKKHIEKVINSNGDTVLLLDARSHSRAVALINIDFVFDKATNRYKKSIKANVVEMEDRKPDSVFINTFSKQYNTVKNYVEQPIGEFTNDMDSKYAYFGNSYFIDFIHTCQLDLSQADVSFTAPLSFMTYIKKGSFYVSDMFKLYKYENFLYTISLTGSEIDDFLEYSTSLWFNTMDSRNDHLLKVKKSENGYFFLKNKYFDFSSASGIDYIIDVTKPDGNKVNILGFNDGNRFYPDSTYLVAVNSYRGNGGGGHLTIGAGLSKSELKTRLIKTSKYDIRYMIMNWIKEKKVVYPKENSNWRIIPEDYYEWGKHKDMKLLFEDHN